MQLPPSRHLLSIPHWDWAHFVDWITEGPIKFLLIPHILNANELSFLHVWPVKGHPLIRLDFNYTIWELLVGPNLRHKKPPLSLVDYHVLWWYSGDLSVHVVVLSRKEDLSWVRIFVKLLAFCEHESIFAAWVENVNGVRYIHRALNNCVYFLSLK
jgi:hypothetical protein